MKLMSGLFCFVIVSTILLASNTFAVERIPAVVPRYSGAQPNEWTMDYEAAFQYATAHELNVIVMFAGSWWCGDCQNLEDVVLTNNQWLSYIEANPVMLVALDFNVRPVYNLAKDHPLNKCFLWNAEYQQANGITETVADARLAYNRALEGEYCVPSSLADNGYPKVSYPSWVIHRSDGTRVGRMNLERSENPTPARVISRYEQALASDPSDEMDDEPLMTPPSIIFLAGGVYSLPIMATLSENDFADNYQFTANKGGFYSFAVNSRPDFEAALLVVSIVDNTGTNIVAQQTIDPSTGGVLNFVAQQEGTAYLQVGLQSPQTNLIGYALTYYSALRKDGFESGMGEWQHTVGNDFNWVRNSGGTPSPGTGPDAASEGDFYLYTEATGNTPAKVAAIETIFDFSKAMQPTLCFDYHMYGGLMGSLHVDVYDGITWYNSVWAREGQQHLDCSDCWSAANINLSGFVGSASVIIRIRAITGEHYLSDIAIDNVRVIETVWAEYALDLTGGDGAGSYPECCALQISAEPPSQDGSMFSHWTVTPSIYAQNFKDIKSSHTTFMMPDEDVTIEASYMQRPLVEPRCSGAQPNQWTMDYEAALSYAATNGLHTIVMFTAEWWCPHCKALEDKLLTNPDWLAYIDANPVMLVMLDYQIRTVYNLPRSELRNRCYLWDTQFLANNGLTSAMGNARVAYCDSLEDAYCLPSLLAFYGYSRVPYPSWIVHRPDGTRSARVDVAGFRDANITPEMAVQAVIRRYQQALLSDPADEMDDEALMSPPELTLSVQEGILTNLSATLSENDLADNFRFTAISNEIYTFIFDAPDGLPGVDLDVSVISSDGTNVVRSAVINPPATNTFVVSGLENDTYYLKVAHDKILTSLYGYILSAGKGEFANAPVPVPHNWLDQFEGLLSGSTHAEAALGDQDGDGMLTWEEYVAGTVPTNRNSCLMATIETSDSDILIGWEPDLRPNRDYQVEGKETLANEWTPANSASRFFRVKVSMP